MTSDLSGKRLELLREVRRDMSRVAILMNPANPVSAIFWEETQAAARKLGIELQRLEASRPEHLDIALASASSAHAIIVFDDPVLWGYRVRIVTLIAERRISAMYGYRDFVDEGG